MRAADEILAAALELLPDERARLARELIVSLDQGGDDTTADEDAVAREWASEIERRVRAAKTGEVALLDGPAVLDEVFG